MGNCDSAEATRERPAPPPSRPVPSATEHDVVATVARKAPPPAVRPPAVRNLCAEAEYSVSPTRVTVELPQEGGTVDRRGVPLTVSTPPSTPRCGLLQSPVLVDYTQTEATPDLVRMSVEPTSPSITTTTAATTMSVVAPVSVATVSAMASRAPIGATMISVPQLPGNLRSTRSGAIVDDRSVLPTAQPLPHFAIRHLEVSPGPGESPPVSRKSGLFRPPAALMSRPDSNVQCPPTVVKQDPTVQPPRAAPPISGPPARHLRVNENTEPFGAAGVDGSDRFDSGGAHFVERNVRVRFLCYEDPRFASLSRSPERDARGW